MCGISGIVTREKLNADQSAAVARMNAAQIHRGPDGAGEYASDRARLAMRRLSIIDLPGGAQPLYNEDASLVLIFNGEIYNYRDLRARLQKSGHQFQTETDGEAILHLYEEDDADFVSHLRGMFAFAIWDIRRQRLTLGRDRMGEKPLYLFERDGALIFSSEMKGLLASGLVPFELDSHAVNLYFHYQYVPEPLTAIKGVRKLDAAHLLTVDAENWRVEEKKYWRIEDAPPLEGDPREIIREKLVEVSRLIVRAADVPIGIALSGGLDSSIVAAFAAQERGGSSLSAFSVGYAGRPSCDERADAAALARHLDLPFREIELDTRSIVESFPQLNFERDDPIADIAGFGYAAVMRLASENDVPVVLQGQGGDELFWGYPQLRQAAHESLKKAALLKRPFSETLKQTLAIDFSGANGATAWARDLAGLRSNLKNVRRRKKTSGRVIFYELSADFAVAAARMRDFYSRKFYEQIANDDVAANEIFDFSDGDSSAIEINLTRLICDTYLRENGVAQGDRLGMASSVELRLPLIDYQFVETVIGLRKRQPDSHLPPKFLLREAARGVLPEWVFNRPKRGFEPPTREWHDALFRAYGDSLRDGFLVQSEILSAAGATQLAGGDFPGDVTSPISFKALVLEQWCRRMRDVVPSRLI